MRTARFGHASQPHTRIVSAHMRGADMDHNSAGMYVLSSSIPALHPRPCKTADMPCEGPERCTDGECEFCCRARRSHKEPHRRWESRYPVARSLLNPAPARQPLLKKISAYDNQRLVDKISHHGTYAYTYASIRTYLVCAMSSTSTNTNTNTNTSGPGYDQCPPRCLTEQARPVPGRRDQIHQDQDSTAP